MSAMPLSFGSGDRGHERRGDGVPTTRVILVGRSALDLALRRDPSLEIVRARTALEAVGELSDSTQEAPNSPHVVIVTPETDPAIDGTGVGQDADPLRAGEFLAALRHVNPKVRVLRLETKDGKAPVRAGYDGVVSEDAEAPAFRAAMGGLGSVVSATGPASSAAPAATPVATPVADMAASGVGAGEVRGSDVRAIEAPLVEVRRSELAEFQEFAGDAIGLGRRGSSGTGAGPVSPAGAGTGTSNATVVGDEAVARQLLQGRDIVDAACELIRSRLGSRDVWFEPATGEARRDAASAHECPVVWRGQTLGRLRSAALAAEALGVHASWLASWLALRDQQSQLREAAFTDPLTGAYNRRFFDHFIAGALEQAREQRRTLTVLVFDIDNFKMYNDRFGHAAGDEILKEAVKLLRSVIRPSDRVCRLGGDEFAVIFHEPEGPRSPSSRPPSSVSQIAQRFQQAINTQKFPKLGREAPGTLGISGGLATYPWDGANAADLLRRADELAMQSKKAGKNAITFGPGARLEHDR